MSSNEEPNLELELSLDLGRHRFARVAHQLLLAVRLVLVDDGPGWRKKGWVSRNLIPLVEKSGFLSLWVRSKFSPTFY